MPKKNRNRFEFPKQLFVTHEGDEGFLQPHTEVNTAAGDHDVKVAVAVYKLVEVGEVTSEVSYRRKRFTKQG